LPLVLGQLANTLPHLRALLDEVSHRLV
jgi:hypothetical protein